MAGGITVYFWVGILIGGLILLLAIPYVNRIRHPKQKPLAAYLIFMTLFGASAVLLFNLLFWLASKLGYPALFQQPLTLALILLLVAIPALFLAGWQAAKPPWRQGPPE